MKPAIRLLSLIAAVLLIPALAAAQNPTPVESGAACDLNLDGAPEIVSFSRESWSISVSDASYDIYTDTELLDSRQAWTGDIDSSDNFVELFITDEIYEGGDFVYYQNYVFRYDGQKLFPLPVLVDADSGSTYDNGKLWLYQTPELDIDGSGIMSVERIGGTQLGEIRYEQSYRLQNTQGTSDAFIECLDNDGTYSYVKLYNAYGVVIAPFTAYADRDMRTGGFALELGEKVFFLEEDLLGRVHFSTDKGNEGWFQLSSGYGGSPYLTGYALSPKCSAAELGLDEIFKGEKTFDPIGRIFSDN